MSQTHEIAHIVGRIAGEGPGHPRQRIARWLQENGREGEVPRFNELYEDELDRHKDDSRTGKDIFASYSAFGRFLGAEGSPGTDLLWSTIVHGTRRAHDDVLGALSGSNPGTYIRDHIVRAHDDA